FQGSADQVEMWEHFELPYRPEVMINLGANPMMSVGNKDDMAAGLKRLKFIVNFDIFLTETSEFADIVLPDCGYLQGMDSRSNMPFIFAHPAGMGDWCWPIRQPVLGPDGEQRYFADVFIELAERIGILPDYNAALNAKLQLEPPHRLEKDRRYSFEEVCDRDLKDKFGADKGYEWFKTHGVIKWPKKPEEVYWRHFIDVRVPIYLEWIPELWAKTNALTEPRGLKLPAEYYQALPDWLPCLSHECAHPGFDFFAFYYRDVLHTNGLTMENAWLDEAAQLDPFSYNIALNEDAGRARGLKTGDRVWVENEQGRKVQGVLRLTRLIHPEGLGIAALAGHWSKHMPLAKDKGVFFNALLALDFAHSSPSNLNLDLCAKVKVSK
ncbi:MAG: molybdopterin-dependent oxidoreductase, partial [Rhodospirillales bacterium]|nr:molybdopterin-dependent oxidoreductase [Rhodospirillales bacterium]